VNGTLFFTADDGIVGFELWKTTLDFNIYLPIAPQQPYQSLYEFSGLTHDHQIPEFSPSSPWEGIQFVK
jgi:hypothetical protein